MMHSFDWITLSRELKSLADAGLRYSEGPYDRERYARLLELASLPMQHVAADFQWPVEFGYATPKVDVRAAVVDENHHVLLVQEASNGLWTLPGGWADLNLTPAENAKKETLEEAGLEVDVVKLIACWDKDRQGHARQVEHIYKLVFLCRITGGFLRTSHETSGVGFFSPDQLPPLCPFRCAPQYIEIALQHAADPDLPTAFD